VFAYAVRGCKQGIFGALSCARRAGLGNLVAAEAGESRLVAGVNSSIALSRSLRSTAATAAVTSTATVTTTLSATTTTAASASASTTSGALRLDEARVEVNGLLDLALALALGLAAGRGEVLLLLVLEGLGVGPLLVELAALVGLTDLETGVESGLLLSLLGEIFLVRDLLLGLLLGGGSLGGSVLSNGILLLVLSDSFTGLLVLKLSSAFVSTPGLGSLLVRATVAAELGRVSVIALTGVSSATSTTDTSTGTASGTITRSLLSGSVLVSVAASTTIPESTLVTTGTTAVTASTTGPYGSLGLDITLSSTSSVLVNGLDRNDGLLLAVTVVAEVGKRVLCDNRHLWSSPWAYRLPSGA
jgi:hypothetical protein